MSLPFSESIVRGLFSSLTQNEQLGIEAMEIANQLGIHRNPGMKTATKESSTVFQVQKINEMTTVTKETPNIFEIPKIKDEDRKSSHNFQLQGVQIKKENIKVTVQPTQENESLVGPCDTCGKCFRDNETLKVHLKIHADEKDPHKCNFCSKKFTNKYTLARHVTVHDPNVAFNDALEKALCSQCPKICLNKYKLNEHLKTHAPGWVRKSEPAREKVKSLCNICSKWLASRHQMRAHTRLLHGENKHLSCSNCGKNFKVSCIGRHEKLCKLSEEEKAAIKVECDQCGKKLANKGKLSRHIRFVHNHEKLFKCKHCDHEDYRGDNMKTHIKNNHQGENPKNSYRFINSAEKENLLK